MRRKRLLALTLLFFLVVCPVMAVLLLTQMQPDSSLLSTQVSPTAFQIISPWSPVDPLVTGTPAAAPIFATRWAVETRVAATSTALPPRP